MLGSLDGELGTVERSQSGGGDDEDRCAEFCCEVGDGPLLGDTHQQSAGSLDEHELAGSVELTDPSSRLVKVELGHPGAAGRDVGCQRFGVASELDVVVHGVSAKQLLDGREVATAGWFSGLSGLAHGDAHPLLNGGPRDGCRRVRLADVGVGSCDDDDGHEVSFLGSKCCEESVPRVRSKRCPDSA